jgi:hypothetical protein
VSRATSQTNSSFLKIPTDVVGLLSLRVFENTACRRIYGPKREEEENGEDYIARSFIIHTPHKIL